MVLLLDCGGVEVLLTGDAGVASERSMLTAGVLFDIDILKVGNHGSRSSTSQVFLDLIHPEVGIISARLENQYEHPHAEVLERLTRAGVQVWLTDTREEDDTVRISSDCETYAVDGVPPQGAQVEAPTATTLVATPTPALSPNATAPLTPTLNEACAGFERERQILLRLAPQLGPEPATGALGGRFECNPGGVSVGVPLSAGHSNSFSITRYATEKEARTGLDGEGEANSTFRGSPALHAVNTGNPMSQSTYDRQSLAWQRSRWVFKATSFDDTHFRIALNVFAASELMYDAAVELGLFPSGGPFTTTPTATDTPVPRFRTRRANRVHILRWAGSPDRGR